MSYAMAINSIARRSPSLRLKRDEVIGAWLATPGFLREETKRVDAEVRALDLELGKTRASWGKGPLSPTQEIQDQWWSANWVPFVKAWQSFYDDHGAKEGLSNYYANFWGTTTWDGLNRFKERLNLLRVTALGNGYTIVGPEPSKPQLPWLDETVKGIASFVKTAVYVLLFGGLAIALVMVIRR